MNNLIKDLEDASDVIGFVDECHQILGLVQYIPRTPGASQMLTEVSVEQGKAEGSLDASNMLKPSLARGLQISGATTLNEYRQTIEKDAALTRRFQPVMVEEPSVEQAVTMLRGLKPKLEVHHGGELGLSGSYPVGGLDDAGSTRARSKHEDAFDAIQPPFG